MNTEFCVSAEDKERARGYFESISDDYDSVVKRGLLRFLRQREHDAVLSMCDFRPGLAMIDVGCGAGFYSRHAKAAGMDVYAVDVSQGMVEQTRQHVDAAVADIDSLRSTRTFDRVICAGVLDFVVDPERALMNLFALVAPRGKLVIFVPRTGLGGWAYRLEKRAVGVKINLFSEKWLSDMAASNSFRVTAFAKPLPTNMVLSLQPIVA